ncbi:hypothetical protein AB0L59_27605 [Streptomyces sp. NPDC052109]|uniref:hypothetical protein n=1 Tax=Streptomyces sp. NPDC052109 TaxID=3155527 RepID=UPI003440141A
MVRLVVAEWRRLRDHSVRHDTAMDRKPASSRHSGAVGAARLTERAPGGVKPQ